MQQFSPPPVAPKWHPHALWLAVAAYFAFVALGSNLLQIRYAYFHPEEAGSWGMNLSPGQRGDLLVQSVDPGSTAAAKGIKKGDVLRVGGWFYYYQIPLAGQTRTFTRVAPGPRQPFVIEAARAVSPPMAVSNPLDRLIDDASRWLMYLGGIFILWRGWAQRSSLFLGLGLIASSGFPTFFVALGPHASLAWLAMTDSLWLIGAITLPLFAIAYLKESGFRVPGWAVVGLWAMLFVGSATYLVNPAAPPGTFPDWLVDFVQDAYSVERVAVYLLPISILIVGWKQSAGTQRHRYALLALAFSMIMIGSFLFGIWAIMYGDYLFYPRWLTNVSSTTRIVGTLLFAYAILRHRVIDLGFAINRTLVYGAVTFILLAAFGLFEYGAKGIVPKAWPEAGAMITAVIAVALFLSFHRLYEWVEHRIEHLFFHEWQVAETELKRFVQSAAYFEDVNALCSAFHKALEKFAPGSGSAIYLREPEAVYRLRCGAIDGAPDEFSGDDAAFAQMRSERRPVEPGREVGSLPGKLALPMLDRHYLLGVVLLGAKPDSSNYRPDEVERLGWAARHVGLDLRALQARQVEEQKEALQRRNSELRQRVTLLQEDRRELLASFGRVKPAKGRT